MSAQPASLEQCQAALTANGFDVFVARDPAQARQIFFAKILPSVEANLVSWAYPILSCPNKENRP